MTLKTIKKDVLSTIKYLVPHSLYTAVNILFTRCCDSVATVELACANLDPDSDIHNVTITLSNPVPNPTGLVVVTLGGLSFPGATISADGKTITILNADLPAGNYVFAITVLYATSESQLSGAYKFTVSGTIAVAVCNPA